MCSTCRDFKQIFPQLGRGKHDYYCQEIASPEEDGEMQQSLLSRASERRLREITDEAQGKTERDGQC